MKGNIIATVAPSIMMTYMQVFRASIRQRNIALVPICHLGFVPTKGPASLSEIPIMVTCKYTVLSFIYIFFMSLLGGIPFSPHVDLNYYSTKTKQKNTHTRTACLNVPAKQDT
jgi:hypothetical protein